MEATSHCLKGRTNLSIRFRFPAVSTLKTPYFKFEQLSMYILPCYMKFILINDCCFFEILLIVFILNMWVPRKMSLKMYANKRHLTMISIYFSSQPRSARMPTMRDSASLLVLLDESREDTHLLAIIRLFYYEGRINCFDFHSILTGRFCSHQSDARWNLEKNETIYRSRSATKLRFDRFTY